MVVVSVFPNHGEFLVTVDADPVTVIGTGRHLLIWSRDMNNGGQKNF